MSSTLMNLDVYITPMRPMLGAPAQGPGDEPMWSPMSATLIHGERDAVLVDTLVTFDQVDALQAGLTASTSNSSGSTSPTATPITGSGSADCANGSAMSPRG